jgi:hypothetical protein
MWRRILPWRFSGGGIDAGKARLVFSVKKDR